MLVIAASTASLAGLEYAAAQGGTQKTWSIQQDSTSTTVYVRIAPRIDDGFTENIEADLPSVEPRELLRFRRTTTYRCIDATMLGQ